MCLLWLIQIDGLDRHLQFVLALHRLFELLIDHLHVILLLQERFLESIVCRLLILLDLIQRVFKRDLLVLWLFCKNHLTRSFVNGENRLAARAQHANSSLFPVHNWTVYPL